MVAIAIFQGEGCGTCLDINMPINISGKVPDTYGFKCPEGMCSGDKQEKPQCEDGKAKPKTDCCKCVSSESKPPSQKEQEECEKEKKQAKPECAPPASAAGTCAEITNKISNLMSRCGLGQAETKNSCADDKAKGFLDFKPPAEDDCTCTSRPCNCGKPVAPVAKPPPCKSCNGKGNMCGPNTSCDVEPLTMVRA